MEFIFIILNWGTKVPQENRDQEMSKEPRTRDELTPREPRVKNGHQNQDQEDCSKIINC